MFLEFPTEFLLKIFSTAVSPTPSLNISFDGLPGISIMEKEKIENRETIFVECYNHDILNVEKPTETILYKVALNKKWKLMVPNQDLVIRDFTDPQENYYGFYSNQIQLYDLDQDPDEKVNLALKYPEIVVKMNQQIDEWWQPNN